MNAPEHVTPAYYRRVTHNRGHYLAGPEREGSCTSPERALFAAILEVAWDDLNKYRNATSENGRTLYAQTLAWFDSAATDWPGQFECVCQTLGLESSAVRVVINRVADGPATWRWQSLSEQMRVVKKSAA